MLLQLSHFFSSLFPSTLYPPPSFPMGRQAIGRQAICMEKPLEAWVGLQVRWSKVSGITRAGQTVRARLMETQIWCPPAGFVVVGVSEKEKWTLPALLSGGLLPASSHPDVVQFSSSQFVPASFKAANPAGVQKEWIWVSKPFKRNCLNL